MLYLYVFSVILYELGSDLFPMHFPCAFFSFYIYDSLRHAPFRFRFTEMKLISERSIVTKFSFILLTVFLLMYIYK